MSEAPERIWAYSAKQTGYRFYANGPQPEFDNVEYVRADRAALEADAGVVAELVEALRFYRDAWSFTTNKRYGGLEWKPKEELLDDCGNTAKAALAKLGRQMSRALDLIAHNTTEG